MAVKQRFTVYHIHVFREGRSFGPVPQLGARFLVDSNSWNVKGTPNFGIVKQMLMGAEPASF